MITRLEPRKPCRSLGRMHVTWTGDAHWPREVRGVLRGVRPRDRDRAPAYVLVSAAPPVSTGLGLTGLGVMVAVMAGVIAALTRGHPHPTLYKILFTVASLCVLVGTGLAWWSR